MVALCLSQVIVLKLKEVQGFCWLLLAGCFLASEPGTGGPRAPAGRRHPLPWLCESHEVSASPASLAPPCPSPATRPPNAWACLLPTSALSSLFHVAML